MMTKKDLYVMTRGIVVIKRLIYIWAPSLLCLYSLQVSAFGFPSPPDSTVEMVTEGTKSMGMTLRIRKFKSRLSVEEVLKFYEQRWDKAVVVEQLPWLMIGRELKGHYYNVQVQKRGNGSWGYLSVSDLPQRIKKDDFSLFGRSDFPAPQGSTVLDDQQHKDPHKTGRTLMLSNRLSVNSNSRYYINHYVSRSWKITGDTQNSRMKSRVIQLQKGRRAINLTISNMYGKTFVVANVVTGGVLDEKR